MSDVEKLNHVIVGIENYDDYLDFKIKRRINNLNLIIDQLIQEKELTKIIVEIREKLQESDISLLLYLIKYSEAVDNKLIKKEFQHQIKERILFIGKILTFIVVPTISLILKIFGLI